MLIDYVTVAAVLAMVLTTMVVSTRGWEAVNTKKGRGTVILVPLLWPIIIATIVTVTLTFTCVFLFVVVNEWMER